MSEPSQNKLDARLARLSDWARAVLNRDTAVSVASADASFRRYFRFAATGQSGIGQTWIGMDAPPDKEDVGPFLHVARMLRAGGVHAPHVVHENRAEGFLLLSDLGNLTYLAALQGGADPESLYRDAITALARMQIKCSAEARSLPPYDAALLEREMGLFPEWFMGRHLGLKIDDSAMTALTSSFRQLIDSALEQPRTFVHRDYHSRNLMVVAPTADGDAGEQMNPGVLDFQDAVYGPVTYDLVSLLRDCYIDWPLERVLAWVGTYRRTAADMGLHIAADDAQFIRWFDLMGVQRHLKAIGIFARLWHRDGKRGYLNDIPRTLGYIRAILPKYPSFGLLSELIEARIVPAMEKA